MTTNCKLQPAFELFFHLETAYRKTFLITLAAHSIYTCRQSDEKERNPRREGRTAAIVVGDEYDKGRENDRERKEIKRGKSLA